MGSDAVNVQQMRVELEKKYSKGFVAKTGDAQIIAIYKRLKSLNKI